jgi:hypothetical protein
VTSEIHADSHLEAGVFHSVNRLLDEGELYEHEAVIVRETLDWFDKNLKEPDRFTKSKRPFFGKKRRAISWFKSSASKHLAMMQELVSVLENHQVPIHIIKTTRPGYVVYEDEFQVVSEPFRDTK